MNYRFDQDISCGLSIGEDIVEFILYGLVKSQDMGNDYFHPCVLPRFLRLAQRLLVEKAWKPARRLQTQISWQTLHSGSSMFSLQRCFGCVGHVMLEFAWYIGSTKWFGLIKTFNCWLSIGELVLVDFILYGPIKSQDMGSMITCSPCVLPRFLHFLQKLLV